MENENKKAYSEVIEILKWIDDEKKLEALPMEMLEVIKSKADPEYKPEISKEIPLEEQDLENETFSILAWIANKYWNESIENQNTQVENEINTRPEKIEENKASDDNNELSVHENDYEVNNTSEYKDKLPVLRSDLTWYQKIKIKIIEIFNKIFRKKLNNQEGNI